MDFSQESLNKIRVAAKLGRDKDIQVAVEQALGEVNATRHWKEEVKEWISVTDSYWNIKDCYNELRTINKNDKDAIRNAIHALKSEEVIESLDGKPYGWYRRKESELVHIDWQNASEEPLNIKLPLGLDKMINLYNGDIFIIAGESNAGKSAICLNIVELNMPDWECHYFSSELGGPKLRKRISLFETPMELWQMSTYDRHDNYHDVLFPNAINVIDFLMVTDDFWKVGTQIKEIHFALRKTGGIAIIALQKDPHKEFGRGGDITRELASLYITLSQPGRAKIVKLKDWKTDSNPNYKICRYKLVNASKFIQSEPWHHEEDENVGRGQ